PTVCGELERQTYELWRQGENIGANICAIVGDLGRKGKDAEAEKVWQILEDTTIKYLQEMEILKKELDFIGKDEIQKKYGYMTIIGDVLTFLEQERTGGSHLPDRDKPT